MKEYMNKLPHEKPTVRFCEYEETKPGEKFGPVVRRDYIIECNLSGYGSVVINGITFPVRPGDCYVLLPGDTVTHMTDAKQPRVGYWCVVKGLSLGRYFRCAGITSQKPFAAAEACEEIRYWMQEMVRVGNCADTAADLFQTACVYGILSALYKTVALTEIDILIDKAIGIIETNYPDPINVTYLASRSGFSRTYFSEVFKKKTGTTPLAYLATVRLEKAALLLTGNTNYTVAQVAEAVGIDAKNFSRLFRKKFGISPLQYRKTGGLPRIASITKV